MKPLLAIALTAALCGCAQVGTSQSIIARPLLNTTTVGGPGYPIVIEGAEAIGLTPVAVAQNLRFPARLTAGSSFRAVQEGQAATNHARLRITPAGSRADSTLTFLHGDRRTGVGTFSLPREAYADPRTLGSVSATLIDTMLREAREQTNSDDPIKLP